ncbi:hypothetical protein [Falsiroseomonas sp. CW058]|uniref:hypothetical protein n=1 Tax=Falsiroseomonas sp. CW058 TaxID=3388664 RepID=UPI003D31528E
MMRRERTGPAPRHAGARRSWRFLWIALGVGVAGAAAVLIMADTAPPSRSRNWGAGLVPTEVPRPPQPAADSATPPLPPAPSAARQAELAAEEARLAALRSARVELERQVEALRQEAEQRRRDMPGRKILPDNLGSGAPVAPQPASGPAAPPAAALPAPAPPVAMPVPPAAPAAPEPAARAARVFVHHRANSGTAAAAAEEVMQTLRASGFEVQAPRPVPFVPSTPVVRYFHEEDQAAAARLAGRLGRGWAIQDFRAFLPQPPPQTLEVWLPGG